MQLSNNPLPSVFNHEACIRVFVSLRVHRWSLVRVIVSCRVVSGRRRELTRSSAVVRVISRSIFELTRSELAASDREKRRVRDFKIRQRESTVTQTVASRRYL